MTTRNRANAIIDAAEAASRPVRIPHVGAVRPDEWEQISRTVTQMIHDLTCRCPQHH
jgi:hypothetical protein